MGAEYGARGVSYFSGPPVVMGHIHGAVRMFGKLVGKAFFGAQGWKTIGDPPPYDKYVLVAAPHTTNWDLPYTLYTSYLVGVDIRWMGKKEIFRFGPWGWWMKHLGGLPVDRSKRNNLVDSAAQMLRDADKLVLVVPPEGTRKGAAGDHTGWRSGFYHIAHKAQVPIVLGFLDYSRKESGFGPGIMPTGDIAADMDKIRAFYRPEMARYPKHFREPRLRDEGNMADSTAANDDGTARASS